MIELLERRWCMQCNSLWRSTRHAAWDQKEIHGRASAFIIIAPQLSRPASCWVTSTKTILSVDRSPTQHWTCQSLETCTFSASGKLMASLGLYRADTIRIKTRVMMRFGSVYDVPISLRACINIIIIRGLVIIPTQTDWRCLLIRDHYKECLIHAIDLVWSKVSSLLVDFEIVRFKIDNLHHMCNEVVPC